MFYLIMSGTVVAILKLGFASEEVYLDSSIGKSNEVDLNETFFASLEGYHVNAKISSEKIYPWIARVIHSRWINTPHLCTASCVDERIFITAARCIFNIKVKHSSIIYRSRRIPVRALVFPTKHTSQYYDDIGFLITEVSNGTNWTSVKLYQKKRPDKAFEWFSKMKFPNNTYNVIGYASSKALYKLKAPQRKYIITELQNIVIGIDICSSIMTFNHKIKGFKVPCYHSCTVKEFWKGKPACNRYHGVEGGAVYNRKDKTLFGVATWGAFFQRYDLPVGFSVVNSQNFFDDFECAKKIRDSKPLKTYQSLCK